MAPAQPTLGAAIAKPTGTATAECASTGPEVILRHMQQVKDECFRAFGPTLVDTPLAAYLGAAIKESFKLMADYKALVVEVEKLTVERTALAGDKASLETRHVHCH